MQQLLPSEHKAKKTTVSEEVRARLGMLTDQLPPLCTNKNRQLFSSVLAAASQRRCDRWNA